MDGDDVGGGEQLLALPTRRTPASSARAWVRYWLHATTSISKARPIAATRYPSPAEAHDTQPGARQIGAHGVLPAARAQAPASSSGTPISSAAARISAHVSSAAAG